MNTLLQLRQYARRILPPQCGHRQQGHRALFPRESALLIQRTPQGLKQAPTSQR
jgi:hypothetical protein